MKPKPTGHTRQTRQLCVPALRPNSYFKTHDGRPPLEHALLAVGFVTVGTWLLLAELSTAIDATVRTDNPAYPGEFACEDSTLDDTPPGCDEPKQIDRDLGESATTLTVVGLLLELA